MCTPLLRFDERIGDGFLDGANQIAGGCNIADALLTMYQVEKQLWIYAAGADFQPVILYWLFVISCG